ncbi:hypothetical protein WMY93_024425 [Mugilogobius chulae]|uniref:L1 transposable element RRM domain-containing protein n=1 Tax=Mugilogobius chulae TaxID=88201 RepID=A0AAW0MZK8_9GOBI
MEQTPDITLKTIWDAIQQSSQELRLYIDAKISPLQDSIGQIQASMSTLCDQITVIEQRVSSNEDNIEDLTKRVQRIEKENAYLKSKVDDAENRSRACNLRFINIPEQKEGRDTIGFINSLLSQVLGPENFSAPLRIERAHRTPATPFTGPKARPRPILVKFLSFQDKIRILRLAREKRELHYQGVRIHVFPDFSVDLEKKRRQFDPIKKKFREMDIKYSLQYPSSLRIIENGKPRIFRTPADAENYIHQLDVSLSSVE